MAKLQRFYGWSQDEPWNTQLTQALGLYMLRAGKRGHDFYCIYKWRTRTLGALERAIFTERARLLDRNTGRIRNMYFNYDSGKGWCSTTAIRREQFYPLEIALSAIDLAKSGFLFQYTGHPLITQRYQRQILLAGERFIDPDTGEVLLQVDLHGHVTHVIDGLTVPAIIRRF